MAKKVSVAKSKFSASKVSIEKKIEEFAGFHSGKDITAIPIGEEPTFIAKPSSDLIEDTPLIEESPAPVTVIPEDKRDTIKKKIDSLLEGK